jgi:hypothetical protein
MTTSLPLLLLALALLCCPRINLRLCRQSSLCDELRAKMATLAQLKQPTRNPYYDSPVIERFDGRHHCLTRLLGRVRRRAVSLDHAAACSHTYEIRREPQLKCAYSLHHVAIQPSKRPNRSTIELARGCR